MFQKSNVTARIVVIAVTAVPEAEVPAVSSGQERDAARRRHLAAGTPAVDDDEDRHRLGAERRTASTASIIDVPRVTVSSVTTTRSPGSSAPAMRPVTPWSFASLRTLKLRSGRPRVAATAAMPKATGSAPMVSPPIAVGVGGYHRERGVGHEQHAVGTARGLLAVEEPRAALPGLQRELAPLDASAPARAGASASRPIGGDRSGQCQPPWRPVYGTACNCGSSPSPSRARRYDDLLAVARPAEELGFDAFFRSDHYLKMGDVDRPARARPTRGSRSPAWPATPPRSASARSSPSATFRLPGPLAISVAQVDQMSGGRVELGLGAGWYEAEHDAYGIPFPPLGERFERLEEQLAIITGLWATPAGEPFDYARARHYQLTDSPAPAQAGAAPRPPIIIGGGGPKRTPRARRPLRRRVQPAVRLRRRLRGRSATGCAPRARRSGRDPGSHALLRRAGAVLRRRRGRVRRAAPPPSAASPTSCATNGAGRHAGRGRRHACARSASAGADTRLPAGARPRRPRPPATSSRPRSRPTSRDRTRG